MCFDSKTWGQNGLCSVFVLYDTVGYLLSVRMQSNTAFPWVGFNISQHKKLSSIFRNFKRVLIMAAWKLQVISLGVMSTVIMKLLFPTRCIRCLTTVRFPISSKPQLVSWLVFYFLRHDFLLSVTQKQKMTFLAHSTICSQLLLFLDSLYISWFLVLQSCESSHQLH